MPVEGAGGVLFVTSSYPRWRDDSAAPFVHHLAVDLRGLGWDVRVLAPHAPGAAREECMDGVPVRRFRYLWPDSLQGLCYGAGAIANLRRNRWLHLGLPFLLAAQGLAVLQDLDDRGTVLVHSHWLVPQGLTAGLAAAMRRRAHLTTVHGSDVFALQGPMMRGCKRAAIRLADAVTANSSATRAAIARLAPAAQPAELIPIGAALPDASLDAEVAALRAGLRRGGGPLIAFVGRLVPEKGADDLLRAVKLVAAELPDATAVIVGDGPERAGLEQLATRFGIGDRVVFTGQLPPREAQMRLRAADVVVGPSRPGSDGTVEGQGLVIAEAMLAGIPVVASAIGGIVDAVRDGDTGLAVPPGSPDAIAGAVRRLAQDANLAHRLAGRATELALASYSREASARSFSALYQRILAARAQAAVREKT